MTTLIMMDEDYSPAGIKRRLKEEFARHGIESETEAAERYGRPQQWVSRRMTGRNEVERRGARGLLPRARSVLRLRGNWDQASDAAATSAAFP